MKKILIIGAGVLQIPAILEAKKMGLRVMTFDYDKNAPGFELADESYEISTIDINTAVNKAKELKPDGVMTLASDMPLRTVAAIAKELNLNAVSEETALAATNKAIMRQKFKSQGVPIPRFFRVTEKNEFIEIIREFEGKNFIVKPADNSGSRGVYLCDDNTDTDHVFDYSKSYSRSGEILIEEYMKGKEVSVETFALNGQVNVIAITDKITTGSPFFVEMGHSQPTIFNDEIQKSISEVARAANQALDIKNGPSHVEIILTEEGPKVVELGSRLGGDNISTYLVPLSTGVNLVQACIKLALNKEPNILNKYDRAASINYFKCPPGRIISIEGTEVIDQIQGVIEFKLFKNIGDIVSEVRNSNDRIGYFICEASNRDQIFRKSNLVLESIKFTVK